jgi:hypothetical protein
MISSTAALHSAMGQSYCKMPQAERINLVYFLLTENETEVLQLLFSAGAFVQGKCAVGGTALHYAAQWGCANTVQLLL